MLHMYEVKLEREIERGNKVAIESTVSAWVEAMSKEDAAEVVNEYPGWEVIWCCRRNANDYQKFRHGW